MINSRKNYGNKIVISMEKIVKKKNEKPKPKTLKQFIRIELISSLIACIIINFVFKYFELALDWNVLFGIQLLVVYRNYKKNEKLKEESK